ncbi:MAG: DUF4175 family protein [Myxococcota bacterium]|nr:DUF4175 family protein [Myxococcota bacterium]
MVPDLPNSVHRALWAVVRRRRWLAVVQSLAWTLLGLGLFLISVPLVSRVPDTALPALRWCAWLWVAGFVVGPLLLFCWPAWRRTSSPLRVARAVDERSPATGDALMTAVDLALARASGSGSGDPVTEALVDEHLRRAGELAEEVDPMGVLPMTTLGTRVLLGPLAALVASVCLVLLPEASQEGMSLLFAPLPPSVVEGMADEGDALPVTLQLRNVRLTLTPPAYSGREELVLDGTPGDFRALPGTRVLLEADVPTAVGTATLQLEGGEAAPLESEVRGHRLRIAFEVPGRSRYRILLSRGAGREPLRSRLFRIEALPDDPPKLEVSGPPDATELHPDEQVRLVVRASDDFALSKLLLVVKRRGGVLATTPLGQVEGLSRWEGSSEWSPGEHLGGRGGKLSLIVEAWDNDTVNGPKVTRSRAVKLYVPTPSDHHDRVLETKLRLLDHALDLLAELLVANEDATVGEAKRESLLREFEHQHRLAEAVFQTAAQLALAMEQDSFERRDVYLGIGLSIENLARRWRPVEDTIESRVRPERTSHVSRSVVARLVRQREATVGELERIVLDLAAFIDLQVGEGVDRELAELEPGLADLASLIRRSEEGEAVGEELQQALRDLAASLQSLAKEMAERSGGPKDGFTNEVPHELGEDLLSEVERLLSEGRHAEALEKVRQAMEAASSLREQLGQENERMAGSQISAELQRQLQESLADLEQLEKEQERVIAETRKLVERHGDGTGMSPGDRAGILEEIEQLRDRVERLPPEGADGMFRAEIRNWSRVARRVAFSLQESFVEGDFEGASGLAESAASYLEEVERVAGSVPPETPGVAAALEDATEGAALARRIAEQLRRAEASAERRRQQASSAGQGVSNQQASVRQGVSKLGNKMGALGGSAYNPVPGREQRGRAGELMERAEDRLDRGQSGSALAAEEDALRQLRALRESLQQSQEAMRPGQRMGGGGSMAQQGRPGGQSNPWGRGDDLGSGLTKDDSEVELSDPDDFMSPEPFRALVQEEAAGDAPERYRPLNRSYYEELVR